MEAALKPEPLLPVIMTLPTVARAQLPSPTPPPSSASIRALSSELTKKPPADMSQRKLSSSICPIIPASKPVVVRSDARPVFAVKTAPALPLNTSLADPISSVELILEILV